MCKNKIFELLVLIESIYSYCSVKDETVLHCLRNCSDLDIEKVIDRLKDHIRKSPYPPSMDELLLGIPSQSWFYEYTPRK